MPLWRVGHGGRLTRFVLRLGPGRFARHAYLNDIISRSLTVAGAPDIKEPKGISRTDGKRPDRLTLILWQGGRCLLWDATVTDTMARGVHPMGGMKQKSSS